MAWKIFNIGKANAEIDRLVAENESLKAKPAENPTQLADALASNEQISNQLTQANSDLATAKQTISTQTTSLEKAQGEVNSVGGALKAACTELKLDVKEGATSLEMITALKAGVSSTLAKLNVAPEVIPAGKPADAGAKATTELKGRERFSAAIKIKNA